MTKWNWIYAGDATGSSTVIRRLSASQTQDILSDKEAVEYVKNSLLLGELSNVSQNLRLPTTGGYDTDIVWESDSPYLTETGVYTAPAEGNVVTANLTANISRGNESEQKIFTATLYDANQATARKDSDRLFLKTVDKVSERLTLPTEGDSGSHITWESSRPEVIAADGTLNRALTDETVVLTATVTYSGASVTRNFTVTVLGMSSAPEESGEKISEREIFNTSLPAGYRGTNCGVDNHVFYLWRGDETNQVSLSKQFDPQPGHIAYVEMEFALQGEKDKIVPLQLFGSSDRTEGQLEIFSARFRINKGVFLKAAADSDYEKVGSNEMKAGEKNIVRWEMNTYTHSFDTFVNGLCVDSKRSMDESVDNLSKLSFSTIAEQSPSGVILYRLESGYRQNYKEMLRADADAITIPAQTTEKISVPTVGTRYRSSIVWKSDSTAAKYENGEFSITRPSCDEKDAKVTITAELSQNNFSENRTFLVTVPREKSTQEALDLAEQELTEQYVKNQNESLNNVVSGLNFPEEWVEGTKISWTSSEPSVIDSAGKVERRFFEGESLTITLTATISKSGETRTKTFTAVVQNPGYDNLLFGKTASAGSVKGSNRANFAVDGNENTVWKPKSGDENPWIQVDMGSLQWVNRACVLTSGGVGYTLKYSSDGSHWQTVASGTREEIIFSPVEARYVRLELSGSNPERGVCEFGIYQLYNDELCVTLDALMLNFSLPSEVTANLNLPTDDGEYGSQFSWVSSDEKILANDGTVTRPKYDTSVTLTAVVSKGSQRKQLPYSLTVSGTAGKKPSDGVESSGGSYVGSQRPSSGGNYLPATPSDLQDTNLVSTKSFSDLPFGHWSEKAVLSLCDRNIIQGDSDGLFYPNREVSRAEFAKMLFEALKLSEGRADFSDVSEEDWYAKAVCSLASAGIVRGFTDDMFCPNEKISRQDMAVMIDRAVSVAMIVLPNDNDVSFRDAENIAEYARQSVLRLTEAGLLHGIGDDLFAPSATATRAQAAQMIYDLLKCRGEV